MTSWRAQWRLKSPALRLFTQPFIQAQINENIKAPRHWPLWRELTGEFPSQRASNAENVSFWWRHHVTRLHGKAFCISVPLWWEATSHRCFLLTVSVIRSFGDFIYGYLFYFILLVNLYTICWTNSRYVGEFKWHDAYLTPLWYFFVHSSSICNKSNIISLLVPDLQTSNWSKAFKIDRTQFSRSKNLL